jgi:hypothetical protein
VPPVSQIEPQAGRTSGHNRIPPRLRPAPSLTPLTPEGRLPTFRAVCLGYDPVATLVSLTRKSTAGAVGHRTLESLSRCARTRSAMLGPSARPVAIPDDVDAPDVVQAHGVIELPPPGSLAWSAPSL